MSFKISSGEKRNASYVISVMYALFQRSSRLFFDYLTSINNILNLNFARFDQHPVYFWLHANFSVQKVLQLELESAFETVFNTLVQLSFLSSLLINFVNYNAS